METPGRVGTSDNDINAIRNMGMVSEGYVVNHYLTDTDAFFIKTDVPNGLKHFVRTPVSTSMEGDFETGNEDTKLENVTALVLVTGEEFLVHLEHNSLT